MSIMMSIILRRSRFLPTPALPAAFRAIHWNQLQAQYSPHARTLHRARNSSERMD